MAAPPALAWNASLDQNLANVAILLVKPYLEAIRKIGAQPIESSNIRFRNIRFILEFCPIDSI